jgi:hypothetical protein
MAKYLHINIPESCHESWHEMTPNQKGRHCLSCQKTVVDFTGMTDAELVSFFTKNKGNTCGRFTIEQVKRNIPIAPKQFHWMKFFFRISLPAFFLSSKVAAQNDTTKPKVEIRDSITSNLQIDTTQEIVDTVTILNDSLKIDTIAVSQSEPTDNTTALMMILGNISPTFVWDIPIVISSIYQVPENGMFPQNSIDYPGNKMPLTTPPNLPHLPQPSTATLFPNPIKSGTTLYLAWDNAVAGTYQFNIADNKNTIVQQGSFSLEANITQSSIVLLHLPEGNYRLHMLHEATGEAFNQAFIIF